MKKRNSFLFGAIFAVSVILVAKSFQYASLSRAQSKMDSNSFLGGEVFTIALPIILLYIKMIIEEKRNRAEIQEYRQAQRRGETQTKKHLQ